MGLLTKNIGIMKKYIIYIYVLIGILLSISLSITAQEDNNEQMKYRRGSLYSILLTHNNQKFAKEIRDVFLKIPVSDKYNDHDLSVKCIYTNDKKLKDNSSVSLFVDDNNIASRLIGRWFDRNSITGECNTDLIRSRGMYNASEFDKAIAEKSLRGNALLEDAGEELIGNTFLLVNDITYHDKAQTGKAIGGIFRAVGAIYSAYSGDNSFADLGNSVGSLAETLKGFAVNVDTYLYQLVWDEASSSEFYTNYYADIPDDIKKESFDNNRHHFRMKFVGQQHSDGSTTSFMGIKADEPEQMIRKACQRALDENIANLQKNYETFRVKTPLVSTSPLSAYIGLKEGVSEKSQYEVLEVSVDKNGKRTYKRVGIIKPIPNMIWDDRYMAIEENAYGADFKYTTFQKVSGKDFYPGLLIREIK